MDNDKFEKIMDNVVLLSGKTRTMKLEIEVAAKIEEILQYCNRTEIADNMVLTMSDVITNELKVKDIAFGGDISSYSEGDMSVSYGGLVSVGIKYGGRLEPFKLIIGATDV